MSYINPSEIAKLPKNVRDNYLAMSAELAFHQGLYGGKEMNVIKEFGFYEHQKEVGYVAWIKTTDGTYFVDLEGKIAKAQAQEANNGR